MSSRSVGLAVCLLALMVSACAEPANTLPSNSGIASDSDTSAIADQVRANWNIGSIAANPNFSKLVIHAHVSLLPDGTITSVVVDNDHPNDPAFRQAAESIRRALLVTHKLKLPPGKTYSGINFEFRPDNLE
jgi:hypothetical protein